MGNFNVDMASNSYDSTQINYFVTSSNLHLVPYQTTHHLRAPSTLLDLCIIDDASKLTAFGQHGVAFLSAHDLIFIKYDIKIRRRNIRTIICRNYENFNEVDFLSEIQDIDWTQVWNSDCINRKVEVLNAKLLECYNKHAPLQQIGCKNLPVPWITNELKAAMHERDMARRTWCRRQDDVSYQRFKTLRNSVQSAVRAAKREYYLSAFVRLSNPHEVWSRLRYLGLVKTRGVSGPLQLSVDELSDFFVQSDGEVTMNTFDEPSLTLEQDKVNEDDSYWKYITPSDIFTVVSWIKSSATGTDGIAPELIKLVLPYIMPVIEHIFNFSLMQGVFPAQWKTARVCPIPKIRNPTLVQHYRLISILPSLSKALERLVEEQICSSRNFKSRNFKSS
ncbi:uncharacterized protein LOC105203117 [Solenopsis invicta]|uniref:uncharacterized protein LOC105203117 n=1 Tax=Solenopsis invicta TaxID=13686 RepID=UPI00059617C8|nr:uncharacterized protein LOC105203117 [Solenopsis invicta]